MTLSRNSIPVDKQELNNPLSGQTKRHMATVSPTEWVIEFEF